MSLLKKIIVKFLPELKPVLYNSLGYNWIENKLEKVELEELTKFYPPYMLVDVKIGKGTYISANSKISHTRIGRFCSIGPNLVCGWGIHPVNGVSTSPYFYSTGKQNGESIATENLIVERKEIKVGNDVFIGANVTILDGITIGDGAVIGAGAVVSKNIPDYAIAVGVPIEIKKYRFSKEVIKVLKENPWWEGDQKELERVKEHFFDIEQFINNK